MNAVLTWMLLPSAELMIEDGVVISLEPVILVKVQIVVHKN